MKKLFLSLSLIMASQSWADDVAPRTAKTFLDDGAYLATSPLRIDHENMWAPITVGMVIGGSALLDSTVRNHLYAERNSDTTKKLRSMGDIAQVSGPIIGTGFLIHGIGADNDKSKETAYLAYETFIWAGGIASVIKFAVGRERPSQTDDPFIFKPGSLDSSFVSGHTTTAFAAATVFSEQYPHWYVAVPAYGIAAATGYSRLAANQHWLSDVIAAAILGTTVAHTLRARHRRPKQSAWQLRTNGSNLELVRLF